jgi:hypothetical protein
MWPLYQQLAYNTASLHAIWFDWCPRGLPVIVLLAGASFTEPRKARTGHFARSLKNPRVRLLSNSACVWTMHEKTIRLCFQSAIFSSPYRCYSCRGSVVLIFLSMGKGGFMQCWPKRLAFPIPAVIHILIPTYTIENPGQCIGERASAIQVIRCLCFNASNRKCKRTHRSGKSETPGKAHGRGAGGPDCGFGILPYILGVMSRAMDQSPLPRG